MSLLAGESVVAVKRVQQAAEIVRELADEAEQLQPVATFAGELAEGAAQPLR